MAEEVLFEVSLDQDFILKNKLDTKIVGLFKIYPNSNLFSSKKRVGTHIIFLLDSSGSMDHTIGQNYTKRQAVIDGATSLLHRFQKEDRVSVITYNSQATILDKDIPALNEKRIQEAILRIKDFDGATNFEAAMKVASKIATSENSHIVFLTDGNSNTGDDSNALAISKQLGQEGITVNAMGIGDDFKYDFMRQFSEGSNGTTDNIEAHEKFNTQQKIRQIFSGILQSAQYSVVRDVFLYISFSSGLRNIEFCQLSPEKRLLTHSIRKQQDGTFFLEVPVGQLVANKSRDYVFSFDVSTNNESSMMLGNILINYSIPQLNLHDQRVEQQILLNLSDNEEDKEPDSVVTDAYEDIELLKKYNDVNDFLDKKENERAARCLKEMINIAERLSDFERKRELTEFLDRLIKNGYLTNEEMNRLAASSSVSSTVGRHGGADFRESSADVKNRLGG